MSILLEQYKECGNNLRHYSSLRFHCLTIFAAINAGLLAATGYADTWVIPVAGAAASTVLLFAEVQINRYVSLFQNEAASIEAALGMALWASPQGYRLVSSRNRLVPVLYLTVTFLWVVLGLPSTVPGILQNPFCD